MAKQLSSFQPQLKSLLDGLVAYWKLDESSGNASDSSGNGYTLTNNNTVTYTTGKINNGATFTGTSNKYLSTATKLLDLSPSKEASISCWFKPNTTNTDSYIIMVTSSVNGRSIDINMPTSTTVRGTLYGGSAGIYNTGTSTVSASGTWYHAVITKNTSDLFSLYINGVFVSSVSASENTGSVTTNGVGMGQHANVAVGLYIGMNDEVGVWNRALSDVEIKALYNSGNAMAHPLGSTPNSTKLYMPLNGNSVDISGNGNHGTDTAVTYVGGKFGQGARFNGSSSQILFNTVPATGINPFTASFWIKASSLVTNMEILAWGNVAIDQAFDVYMNSSSVMTANFYGGGGIASATTKLTTQNWQYVTVTYDGTNTRIYINGRFEAISSNYTSANIGTTNKFIGKDNGGGNWWNGLADEIILESRAWTPQEVSLYYRKSMLNYQNTRNRFMAMLGIAYNTTINTLAFTSTVNSLNVTKSFIRSITTTAYTFTLNNIVFGRIMSFAINTLTYLVTLLPENIRTNTWRNPDNKSSTTYTNPDNKSSTTWTNTNKNS